MIPGVTVVATNRSAMVDCHHHYYWTVPRCPAFPKEMTSIRNCHDSIDKNRLVFSQTANRFGSNDFEATRWRHYDNTLGIGDLTVHHNMNHAVDPIIITDAKCVCEKARRLWLQPENDQSLNQAEWLYRQIWNRRTTTTTTDGTDAVVDDNHVHDRIHHVSKKSKTENVPGGDDDDDDDNINKNTCDADTTDWVRHAGEKLALMLLQSVRSTEADQILTTLQYTCR